MTFGKFVCIKYNYYTTCILLKNQTFDACSSHWPNRYKKYECMQQNSHGRIQWESAGTPLFYSKIKENQLALFCTFSLLAFFLHLPPPPLIFDPQLIPMFFYYVSQIIDVLFSDRAYSNFLTIVQTGN
jgi:hypothetical protein